MAAVDPRVLAAALDVRTVGLLEDIETFDEIDSTNTYLSKKTAPTPRRGHVAWADHQTTGRGRRDNRWHSRPGHSLCLSVAWQFAAAPENLPALTLAHGAAIVDALTGIGATGLAVKWPNDILFGHAKLGGILTESQVRGAGGVTVVTGVGLNLQSVDVDLSAGGWSGAVSSLDVATSGGADRLPVAVAVIEAMVDVFDRYEAGGFDAFRERYEHFDALRGCTVDLDTGDAVTVGNVRGIDNDGALLLDTDGTIRRIVTGSIRRIHDGDQGDRAAGE